MTNPLRPDRVEEDQPQDIDDMVPTRGYAEVPVVGLGGSAGGIEALQDFFTTMPSGSGLAFIVVMHLAREHDSLLPQILQRCTRMPVRRAEDGARIEPGHVYVIPGGKLLQCINGKLRLEELPGGPGRHVTVDVFFRSLADSHGPHAAAVILSGMDGDGAVGIKRIKERGGLAIVHDPQQAEHDGMPRSAIATGMVDWVLPIREMPGRLLAYFRLEEGLLLPREEPDPAAADSGENAQLTEVLRFVRSRTGLDFELYKRGTVVRRIARRMQLNGVDNLKGYLNCLQQRPGETGALLQDLLISVTNFFRDDSCFEALEQHIPPLFAGKGPQDVVRVWVVACATGEEAYSVAIALTEYAETLQAPPAIQVFATDLDEEAIQAARYGAYPGAITADVSEPRLRRFFHKEAHGWRVRRELREKVLFATHDVLRDPPFSHVALITCRNLLIYLTREAQARVLQTLHFALTPQAVLMLGTSETVEEGSTLFEPVDKKHRIYRKVASARSSAPLPSTLLMSAERQSDLTVAPPVRRSSPSAPLAVVQGRAAIPGVSWREIHMQLIEHLAPPSVLVDAEYDLLHVSPGAARLLQFAAGEPTRSLLRALPVSAHLQMRAALGQAAQTSSPVLLPSVELEAPTGRVVTRVRVVPLQQPAGLLFLVTLEPVEPWEGAAPARRGEDEDPLARHLDFEMDRLKHQLRDTAEQYEASTEELKASNEELQAMYEEMRAQSEELETGKEELQSVNEELSTVNFELKDKVEQLSKANSDMHNLMDATAIATVFLDRELRITRYTPAAVKLFNLIPTDLGRPLTDMASRLDYPRLGEDARGVLERLVPVEREVGQPDGSWYLARLMPYRTLDDRIAGVVFTFIDISERKRAEETRLWLSAVVTSTPDAVISFALDQNILSWNSGAERMFGFSAQEAIGKSMHMLAPGREEEQERLASDVNRGRTIENLETVRRRKDGRDIHVGITAAPIRDGAGAVVAASLIMRDIGAARAAAEALRQSEERLRMLVENIVEYAVFSLDLQRRITVWNSGAQRFLGYTEQEALGQLGDIIFTAEDRAAGAPQEEAGTALREGRAADERVHVRKDGSRFHGSGVMMLMRNGAGEAVGFVKILRDRAVPVPSPRR